MRIYISSSWKNRTEVRTLAIKLRQEGHTVYDFTDPAARDGQEIPPEKYPEQFDPSIHQYSTYLDNADWRRAVTYNKRAIEQCDAVFLLLPCGIDATADWALAVGLGKPSVVIGHPRKGERSPVHLWADAMVDTVDAAIIWAASIQAN